MMNLMRCGNSHGFCFSFSHSFTPLPFTQHEFFWLLRRVKSEIIIILSAYTHSSLHAIVFPTITMYIQIHVYLNRSIGTLRPRCNFCSLRVRIVIILVILFSFFFAFVVVVVVKHHVNNNYLQHSFELRFPWIDLSVCGSNDLIQWINSSNVAVYIFFTLNS